MDLARLVERGEEAAFADMYRAAPRDVAESLGLEASPLADGTAFVMRAADETQFNRVFGLGLDRPIGSEDLDTVLARYRPLGFKRARLQLAPAVEAQAGLAARLAERGLERQPGGWTKRARATEVLPQVESPLSVIDATDAPGAFGQVASAGFGMPPVFAPWLEALVGRPDWRIFVAVEGERPVTAGALYLAEDCGWLGIGATLTDARGKGGQGLIMRARLEAARLAGKAWAITETGAPGPGEAPGPSYRNMDRHGFVEVHVRPNYAI